jgi:hypothetical protein
MERKPSNSIGGGGSNTISITPGPIVIGGAGVSGKTTKTQKSMKLTNPEDLKVMSGQTINQIINYSFENTNQFYISGGAVTNNILPS